MKRVLALCLSVLGTPLAADDVVPQLISATRAAFPELPAVTIVDDIATVCGGGAKGPGVYCPTERRIFLAEQAAQSDVAAYTLAHLYGHALQVTYGVADVALAAIRAEPDREDALRGMVTRQVECLAGVLIERAGLTLPDLADVFEEEPFTGSHWGRNPVRNGPQVSIGLDARIQFLAIGMAEATPEACSVGEMRADLIVANDRAP